MVLVKLLRINFYTDQLAFIAGKKVPVTQGRHCPGIGPEYLAACGGFEGIFIRLGQDELPTL
jgi:hypothetical protein